MGNTVFPSFELLHRFNEVIEVECFAQHLAYSKCTTNVVYLCLSAVILLPVIHVLLHSNNYVDLIKPELKSLTYSIPL
jgi:hypothetical protein